MAALPGMLPLTLKMTEPHWMMKARYAALRLRAATLNESGARHSVYVILLHDPRRSGRWGLYVGQTSRDPDWRFDQHKAGYKASRAVKRFGVCLLPELVDHLNPMSGPESLHLEAALAQAFRASGVPWVEGGH
jgi:predicted GIY-YIG superfamily endonuclease